MIVKVMNLAQTKALVGGTSVEITYVNGTKLIIGKIGIEINGVFIRIDSLLKIVNKKG